jgi:hypothetical protein
MRVEEMGPHFTKYHLGEGPWPFSPVIHHLKDRDHSDPHSHPWDFHSHILKGWYVEERWARSDRSGLYIEDVQINREGESLYRDARAMHKIVDVSPGGCWTLVMAREAYCEALFWHTGVNGVVYPDKNPFPV